MTTISGLFSNGGTIVLAILCVWLIVQDRIRNSALLEEIKEIVRTLKVSNENISKTLELLQDGCEKLDDKIDRNYEYIKYGEKEDNRHE